MSLDMVIKHIPAVRVAQVRYGGEEGIDFDALVDFGVVAFGTLFGALAEAGVDPEGPQFSYYEDRDDDTMLWPILAVPIGEQPFATTDEVETAVAPAIDAVVTMHRGAPTHDIVRPIYGQMARSAEDHGYRFVGPGRDCVVAIEGNDLVMELQLPVADQDPRQNGR